NQRRRFETLSAAVRHYDVRRVLASSRKDLGAQTTALLSVLRTQLRERRRRIERMETALEALSPLAILARGYALVFDESGSLLKDAAKVNPGDKISARLAHGTLNATVNGKQS
ncbi:MAG TPA: exodeoxyribonuclease VII large subunit, partial [Terriglobales bacterium]|nr:exodeoxyribonuclease VII large subunit [Terriglobales bacterium]